MTIWDFFIDPVLRGPTWGTLLMCVASSLMGVVLLLKKRCLVGESLSHAAYPGILAGVFLFSYLFPGRSEGSFFAVLGGAFATSLLGLKTIEWMEKKRKVSSDAALCFVLAVFFGAGIVAASALQTTLPGWHRQAQSFLFGQAATMTDGHIALYASLTILIVFLLSLAFRPLQALLFDPEFSKAAGLRVHFLERAVFWLLLFSLILGIRSVGIVLMSGMAIAPAIAARQFTDRLSVLFWLAGLFGALSGLTGNILSVVFTLISFQSQENLTFPTGPMIILAGSFFSFSSLLFAPKRGWIFRLARMVFFRLRCLQENVLKALWKKGGAMTFIELRRSYRIAAGPLAFVLWRLKRAGWIEGAYELTRDGAKKAASIVRLHRLWELYLASELGVQGEKIHLSAEEMEHILTPDLEKLLTCLLADPKIDPHQQPIPERSLL